MESSEFLKIKCPECGAVLTVRNEWGIEQKRVKCPVCKQLHKFMDFKPYVVQSKEDKTEYEVFESMPGKLVDISNGTSYDLSLGKNTIGRKAGTSQASVQIETSDRYMSRVHIEIRFDGRFHFLRVLTEKNPTLVNGQVVHKDEELILQGGETITLANTPLLFQVKETVTQDDKTII